MSEQVNGAPPAPPKPPDHGSRMRAAGLISALTLLSRLLGLAREQAFAALLGAGLYADAFQAAFRIPNLLRDLFAEGALSAAFVPTYARALAAGGPARARQLSSRVFTLLAVVVGALVLVGLVMARPLVQALAPGFEQVPGKAEMTVLLTRIMLPFLLIVSFAAVAMGMHNAEERYGPPALAPSLFNLVTILWAVLLWAMGLDLATVAVGWAVGTLLGGLAQFVVQVPPLWRAGWRFRPEWAPKDPGIRAIASLMAPATMGLAAVQVNIFVSTIFASHEPGAVSWLTYSFRVLYLPIGVFGVALGTIATTGLARRAAAGDMEGMRVTLRQSLRMLAFLTLPATVGLIVLGVPIIRLLFERGLFAPLDTERTAAALAFYAVGLVAYTGVKILAPAFYSLGRPRVPLLASASAVATNLLVIFLLHSRMGYRAVALGTSLGALVNALVLLARFEKDVGGLRGSGMGRPLVKMAAAASLMGPAAWGAAALMERAVGTTGLVAQALTGLVPVAAGGGLYFGLAVWLRIPEAGTLLGILRRRKRQVTAAAENNQR